MRAPVPCVAATPAGIRHWYKQFATSVSQLGYYVHPLYCFRRDHGGEWGFTCGDAPTDDLPQRLALRLPHWSSAIFRLLSKPEMFPKDSNLSSVVSQCDGDGYKTLRQILLSSHPAFHPQPANMVTEYPKQGDLTLLEYRTVFLDHLQLCGFIKNFDLSLDQTTEMDTFIKHTRYCEYFNTIVFTERQQPDKAHLYTSSQIVATLETLLKRPGSPTANLVASPTATAPANPTTWDPHPRRMSATRLPPTRLPLPRSARVMPVGLDVLDSHANSLSEPPSDPSTPHFVPDPGLDDAALNPIQARPKTAAPTSCLVCGEEHRFDSCPVLQDTTFLKAHLIRSSQHFRREAQARASAFPSTAAAVPVGFVDQQTIPPAPEDLALADELLDFHMGRR